MVAGFGATIVSKFSERKIQYAMGSALFITAFIMFAGKMHWMPGGGQAIGLHGWKLVVACSVTFLVR